MTRDARQPDGLAVPKPPYSPVVLAGDVVFTAGQVAMDGSGAIVAGGIVEQTRQVMSNVAACLAVVGCTMDDIVKTTVFLTDLADFTAFNEEYARHLAEPYPARSTVQVGLALGLLVEVEVVARRPTP
jgi:2-iminobutanoate/2-iminopropanoate deaminase